RTARSILLNVSQIFRLFSVEMLLFLNRKVKIRAFRSFLVE
uniref:Uncharacterized protein n=1 Tax=Ciona intestinalis TaxID=7719 RepID=H2Y1L0_CIOIN